jgi:hypothetical protein
MMGASSQEEESHGNRTDRTVSWGTKEQYDYLGELMGEGVANQPERRLLAAGPAADGSIDLSKTYSARRCSRPATAAIPTRRRSPTWI